MNDHLLYFPFINVPNSGWLNRSLLYWDTVSSIVPYEFAENPELLSPHMRELVRAELVLQVDPHYYIERIPEFGEAFGDYMTQNAQELSKRSARFKKSDGALLHFDKMSFDVMQDLRQRKLARESHGFWLEVEETTANEYMAYLASAIGKMPELQLVPMTDDPSNLNTLIKPHTDQQLDPLRCVLLKEAFLAPTTPLKATDIEAFKRKNSGELQRFRNWVEQKVTGLAAIGDANLQERQTANVIEELSHETDRIRSNMRQHGWLDVVAGDLSALLSPMPIVGQVAGIVHAVYNAVRKPLRATDSPLAYAAYAQRDLDLA